MTDPLFAGMRFLPRLNQTCPNCKHAVCGNCSNVFIPATATTTAQPTDISHCCVCNHEWDESAFHIPLSDPKTGKITISGTYKLTEGSFEALLEELSKDEILSVRDEFNKKVYDTLARGIPVTVTYNGEKWYTAFPDGTIEWHK